MNSLMSLTLPRRRLLLGEALRATAVITEEQLADALREQVQCELLKHPRRLGEILLHRRSIDPQQLNAALAQQAETLAQLGDDTHSQLQAFLLQASWDDVSPSEKGSTCTPSFAPIAR